ncbi:hypothetical protein BDV23DRAFT_182344 [Aspergillus alliaceus]|uniref:Uncharacterized protein n=1 Tax=Petromyces alliaceus TaxID=209559 RepID=A0A5N7CBP5_PETAA|nr:hypothetical protein BDV23DRAFT_182344 [Aspergillus alliaceus]
MSVEKVEFKSLNGLVLRGNLYLQKRKALPLSWEEAIDPRTLGESEGLPRNEFDPAQLAEHYSVALAFLPTHRIVNPNQIEFWGISFNGPIALRPQPWTQELTL